MLIGVRCSCCPGSVTAGLRAQLWETPKKPRLRPATLAGSVSEGAVLQLNNSALCSGSGPAERAAPLENANEAGAAEQQQPAAVCTQKAKN